MTVNRVGEMVVNRGFEDAGAGGADVLAGWTEYLGSTSDGVIEQSSATCTEGTYCAKLTACDGADNAYLAQHIRTLPGTVLTLTMDTRGDGTYSPSYQVYDFTNSTTITGNVSTSNTTTSWVTYSTTFTCPAGCYRMILYLRSPNHHTGGVSYYDNVSMYLPRAQLPVIRRFGDTWALAEELPLTDAAMPHGPGQGQSTRLVLPGGLSYDWGRDDVPPPILPRDITIRGEWVADSLEEMQAKADALNALLGKRSKLWRDHGAGLSLQWIYARCVEVTGELSPRDQQYWAEYTLVFETDAGPWYGRDWTQTHTLARTSTTIVCRNDGNAHVTAVTMTFDPGAVDITDLGVAHNVVEDSVAVPGLTNWYWSGTISVGETLIVDSGDSTVTVGPPGSDLTDGYQYMEITPSLHKVQEFVHLVPGYNNFVISRTGGDATATVEVSYYEGWY
ncbi:MAG: carbohydrate binding domain-containing protein [bacterium]